MPIARARPPRPGANRRPRALLRAARAACPLPGGWLLLGAWLLLGGCAGDRGPAPEAADLILHHGHVVTLDPDRPEASVVVVRDERIVAVGGAELLDAYAAPETVDLGGRTLLPGFVDSHTHLRGRPERFVPLAGVPSIAALGDRIEAKRRALGPGEWITGYGWSEDELVEGRRPNRFDLDSAVPDAPVLLTRAGGHSAVANSLALELAGIDATTPDPDGGVIERDADGEPTGVIRERQDLVSALVPPATEAELEASLVRTLREQFALGITSFTDAAKEPDDWPRWLRVYAAHGDTLPRARVQMLWPGAATMATLVRTGGTDPDHLALGPVKVFADGGFTGPAAYTKDPYLGQGDYRGYLTRPEPELRALIAEVHEAGYQLGVHAIGDAAIELTVDALADALERTPRPDHRHYLNHFSMRPSDATMERMADHGIAITQQPNFTYTLEGRYVANLDGWRLEHNNPLRSPMDHGIHVAISSDILPIGPMVGLYAAVTRKGRSGRVFGADEAITIEEALRAYTVDGAWLVFAEADRGSVEPGKLADLIELSADPLTIDPEALLDVQVLRTWLGGRLVYERGE
jgi:predicted amidohydrolase YtcJ